MFKSAVMRLTLGYVAALALMCLMFSIPIYSVASNRLRSGAERQAEAIRRTYRPNRPANSLPELVKIREEQLAKDRSQLLSGLLIINISIIAIGGYLSYLFARRTLRPIQEAHKLQKDFTANASHELRTPLAVIQAQSEVVLRNRKLKLAEARQVLASNLEEVFRLQEITSKLLSLTNISGNGLRLIVCDVVDTINKQVDGYAKDKDIELTVEAKQSKLEAPIDKVLLPQAVAILLDNAIKYTPPERKSKIIIKIQGTRQSILIQIIDNGIGIKETDRDKVFDRFYRGKNHNAGSNDSSNGSGLGLAIAKQIIGYHQGELSLDSTALGKGSTFAIKLPRKIAK